MAERSTHRSHQPASTPAVDICAESAGTPACRMSSRSSSILQSDPRLIEGASMCSVMGAHKPHVGVTLQPTGGTERLHQQKRYWHSYGLRRSGCQQLQTGCLQLMRGPWGVAAHSLCWRACGFYWHRCQQPQHGSRSAHAWDWRHFFLAVGNHLHGSLCK
jgi:hypothetical protein